MRAPMVRYFDPSMHSLEVHLDQGDQMARRAQSRISSLYSRFVGKNEAACVEAIASLLPATAHVVYAASWISSKLKGSITQFGWLQASAINSSFLSAPFKYSATHFSDFTLRLRPLAIQTGGHRRD